MDIIFWVLSVAGIVALIIWYGRYMYGRGHEDACRQFSWEQNTQPLNLDVLEPRMTEVPKIFREAFRD